MFRFGFFKSVAIKLLVGAACLASLQASAVLAYSDKIVAIDAAKAIKICSSSAAGCTNVSDSSNNHDLEQITQLEIGLNSTATWIERRSLGYSLCALNEYNNRACVKIDFPKLGRLEV